MHIIPADLTIPDFLRVTDTPESKAAREKLVRQAKRGQPVKVPKAERRKGNYDAEGRRLPDSMDATSWALLRSIERTAAKEAATEKAERFRLLKIAADEKRAVRAAAKAAKLTTQ